jgi:hypothetical protein
MNQSRCKWKICPDWELAKGVRMNDAQRAGQRNGFVYGNTKIANPNVTREMVDDISRGLPPKGEDL